MGVSLYAVGEIVGCFGIKGFLKIRPLADSAERLKALHKIFVGKNPEMVVPYKIGRAHV